MTGSGPATHHRTRPQGGNVHRFTQLSQRWRTVGTTGQALNAPPSPPTVVSVVEYLIAYFATAKAGLMFAPLNYWLRPAELELLVDLADPACVMVGAE